MTDSIYLLAVLCAVAGVAEWLGRFAAGRWLGGAIILPACSSDQVNRAADAMAAYRRKQGMN